MSAIALRQPREASLSSVWCARSRKFKDRKWGCVAWLNSNLQLAPIITSQPSSAPKPEASFVSQYLRLQKNIQQQLTRACRSDFRMAATFRDHNCYREWAVTNQPIAIQYGITLWHSFDHKPHFTGDYSVALDNQVSTSHYTEMLACVPPNGR